MNEEPSLHPIPFEDPIRFPSFWLRVGLTLGLAFTAPMAFYQRLPAGRGLSSPWRFKLLLSMPWYLGAGMFMGAAGILLGLAALAQPGPIPILFPAPMGTTLLLGALLVAGPLLQFFTLLGGGAFQHFLLKLWGGAKAGVPATQTMRAVGYTQALAGLSCLLLPPLAILVLLAGKIVLALGLARMHRTDRWRALGAVATQCALGLLAAAGLAVTLGLWVVRVDGYRRQIIMPPPLLEEPSPDPSGPPRISVPSARLALRN